jgi:hypothetical protein
MKKILPILIMVLCWSCTHDSGKEKYQGKRNNIVNVQEKIRQIPIEDVMISQYARLLLIDEYLLISDHHAPDKLIHVFDRKNFNHITSTGTRGQGPGEIANIGYMEADPAYRRFFVSDHGKQKIFCYYLDSLLANPSYLPEVKMTMKKRQFPSRYHYVNDTLCIGSIIEPIGNSDYEPTIARWNMLTGEITPMKYRHPRISRKRVCFAASVKHGIYVEGYSHHDLMTICSLDGELKYNIYGNRWDNRKTNSVNYYHDAVFCKDRIFTSFSEGNTASLTERYPTKFLIFNMDGDYIQTLETNYQILTFCYDENNNRIIMHLDDEIQFACLELDGLTE